jgi:hypothetical protein
MGSRIIFAMGEAYVSAMRERDDDTSRKKSVLDHDHDAGAVRVVDAEAALTSRIGTGFGITVWN